MIDVETALLFATGVWAGILAAPLLLNFVRKYIAWFNRNFGKGVGA